MPTQPLKEITYDMMEAFSDNRKPTNFLTSMFRDNAPTNQDQVAIDARRTKEDYAIDVGPCAKPNQIDKEAVYTDKLYDVPWYNQVGAITACSMKTRQFGMTASEQLNKAAWIRAKVLDMALQQQEKIERSIEKQCWDSILNGQIVFANTETVNYYPKASHNIVAPTSWDNPAANIFNDIYDAAYAVNTDGKVPPNIIIAGAKSFQDMLDNTGLQSRAKFTTTEAHTMELSIPEPNRNGAYFHGYISVNSFRFELWTYPSTYTVPEGYGLPNEGESVQYLPDDRVVVMSNKTRLDLKWAGIFTFDNLDFTGSQLTALPRLAPGEAMRYQPYAFGSQYALSVGLISRPLAIPTQIDGIAIIDTQAT